MTERVVWRLIAEQDVVELAVYIGDDNPMAGARFMDAVDDTVHGLLRMPDLGRSREFVSAALQRVRSISVKDFPNHLIFYCPTNTGVEVLRVLHGARDIEALFNDEH